MRKINKQRPRPLLGPMRTAIAGICLCWLIAGCNSGPNEEESQSGAEFVYHLFSSKEFYKDYQRADRDQAERLLENFLEENAKLLRSGGGEHEEYYLSNIVLTKARLGIVRALKAKDVEKLERYLNDALPAYRSIQGRQSVGKADADLRREIIVWVLALDLGQVSWLSVDELASLNLNEELKEVQSLGEDYD